VNIQKITPEVVASPEENGQTAVEASPLAELVSTAPDPSVTAPVVATPVVDVPVLDDTRFAETVVQEEVKDLTSSSVEKADENWTTKVRTVIKNDEGQPFKEEADAEILNKDYMKQRFNVDVDAPVEEK